MTGGNYSNPDDHLVILAPVLSQNGGIKSIPDISTINELSKDITTKLVGRCIFCNILMNTEESILNKFIEEGGWDRLNLWLREAIQSQDFAFLLELLKVFARCPVGLNRLKLNNTPKLLKVVSKSANKTVARTARLLIDEWKSIVARADDDDKLTVASIDLTVELSRPVKKRRDPHPSEENSHPNIVGKDSKTLGLIKKLKTRDENARDISTTVNESSLSLCNISTAIDSNHHNSNSNCANESALQTLTSQSSSVVSTVNETIAENGNKSSVDSKDEKSTVTRSSSGLKTAKVKFGKARSIGVLPSEASAQSTHRSSPSSMSLTRESSRLISPTASAHSSFAMNRPGGERAPIETGIRLIEAKPMPPPILTSATSSGSGKHVIKESAGFMDAISSNAKPTLKKKRKTTLNLNSSPSGMDSLSNGGADSAANDSFDSASGDTSLRRTSVDFADEDVNRSSTNITADTFSDDAIDNSQSIEASAGNWSPPASTSSILEPEFLKYCEKPFDPLKTPNRGILSFSRICPNDSQEVSSVDSEVIMERELPGQSQAKRKKIQWAESDSIVKMVYFELDDQERCNVYKQGQRDFAEHRAQEMRLEKSTLSGSRGTRSAYIGLPDQHRPDNCVEYMAWRLIPIELEGVEFERGEQSCEKLIQAERFKTVLPNIYLPGQQPEAPSEPDQMEVTGSQYQSTDLNETPKLIPLEDENNQVRDYSNFELPSSHNLPTYDSTNDSINPYDPYACLPEVSTPFTIPPVSLPPNGSSMPAVSTAMMPIQSMATGVPVTAAPYGSIVAQQAPLPTMYPVSAFGSAPTPAFMSQQAPQHYAPPTGPAGSYNPEYMNAPYGYPPPMWDNNAGWPPMQTAPASSSSSSVGIHGVPPPQPVMPPTVHHFAANRRPVHKTLCKFWVKHGNCKFDTKCNFLHQHPPPAGPGHMHFNHHHAKSHHHPHHQSFGGSSSRIRDKIR